RITEVDTGKRNDLTDHAWSPDSRWLAYAKTGESSNSAIWVYSLDSGRTQALTGDETDNSNPVFDPKGRYLYFLSNRDYNLAFSAYEFNFLYRDATRIYAATLADDGPALYMPKSDEAGDVARKAQDDAAKAKPNGDKSAAPAPVRIDIDGFNQRVIALGAPAGTYGGLSANAEGV